MNKLCIKIMFILNFGEKEQHDKEIEYISRHL